ncbi:Cyclophilin seven suppressor, putative [Pediculus humanus corporis]|uniref:Cyclophilin seven suppressor, putative n=1 Tax=Pediculus humanus subsp. corporis TaxID=121224 RepID=E0VSH0_PEDHC|nr:Cyclophilin seven suppressor, putative [Pediculus humanus corporis]EEB16326.1 Cyclophilin seven suppressor, putative [Pediculus humanus corporis]
MDTTKENNGAKKKPMTHEERLALAAKLDKELDEFIDGLEKKRYTEGWPEDKWQEEMEKHPFFMTKVPEDGTLSPLLEGIQQLKYDENENTPLELAQSYKEDGNFNFKYKKYRMAIISYTEGIRKNCNDNEVQSQLYSNRAAAHYHLGNYRSSLADCRMALKFVPEYHKAKIKAAQCCLKLKMYDDAIDYCNDILKMCPNDANAIKIQSEAQTYKKIQERDKRKQKKADLKFHSTLEAVKSAVMDRNIPVEVDGDILNSLEFASEKPILENGTLYWPVFFLYPEYSMSDYIQQFNENDIFFDHLVEMFTESPPWDTFKKYKPNTLSIYYEGSDRSKLYSVDLNKTLLQVLTSGK